MNPTIEEMLAECICLGWPDPFYHAEQYQQAINQAKQEGAAWTQ